MNGTSERYKLRTMSDTLEQTAQKIFGEQLLQMVLRIAAASADRREKIHLVGGAIRDMFLGLRSDDIDIVVEGDAIAFAKQLHAAWPELMPGRPAPGKPIVFPKYGTAKLAFQTEIAPGVTALDFSSARAEDYPTPGGRPVTRRGDLREDLARRDFSINAMALEVNPEGTLTLSDFHGGESHLENKILSVLHDKSFVDDPARLIRGMRFAARFGFMFSEPTHALVEQAVSSGLLATLPRARLFDEFRKALCERNATAVIARLNEGQVLQQISPAFEPSDLTGLIYPANLRRLARSSDDTAFAQLLSSFSLSPADVGRIVRSSTGGR